jgi:hypothetical protein
VSIKISTPFSTTSQFGHQKEISLSLCLNSCICDFGNQTIRPFKYAIPLARRWLINWQTNGNGNYDLAYVGYDKTIVKGTTLTAHDREGNPFGGCVVTGRSITTDLNGVVMNLTARKIVVSENDLQDLNSYAHSIRSAQQEIWTFSVPCTAGFVFGLDSRPLGSVTVEARKVGDAAWVDLEAGDIDLSPWDGTAQDFEIRVTADAVSTPVSVQINLTVHT